MASPKPPAAGAAFVHLRLHTEYSLVDGIVRVPELMQAVAARGMPAVALTDHANLFAMVKFHREAERAGIKPLIGADLWIDGGSERAEPVLLTLIAKDPAGYRNLTRLVSRTYLEGQARGRPLLSRDWLDPATTAGLIALAMLAGCATGASPSGAPEGSSPSMSERFSQLFASNRQASAESAAPAVAPQIDCPPVDIRQGASTYTATAPGIDSPALALRYQGIISQTARECAALGATTGRSCTFRTRDAGNP